MVAININELLAHRAEDLRIQQGETKTISGGDPKIAGDLYFGLSIPDILVSTSADAFDTESEEPLPSISRETGGGRSIFFA